MFHLDCLSDDLVGAVFASDAFVSVDAVKADFVEFGPRAAARSHSSDVGNVVAWDN